MGTFSAAVTCAEVHGTRTENAAPGTFQASVVLECAYSDRYTLISDLLLNQRSWPSFTECRAKKAAIVPFASAYTVSGQETVYTHARVTVQYDTIADSNLISESIEPTADFRTLDHRLFRWGSNSGPLLNENQAPGQIIRGMNLVRTIYNMAAVPVSYLTLPGKVNNAVYSSALLGLTFAPQTLLFQPGQLTRTIKLSGTEGFTAQVKMSFNPNGWNTYWNESAQAYQGIFVAGGAQYISYPLASFADWLF